MIDNTEATLLPHLERLVSYLELERHPKAKEARDINDLAMNHRPHLPPTATARPLCPNA